MGSLTNRIDQHLDKKRRREEQDKRIRDMFNGATSEMLEQYFTDVIYKKKSIESVRDLKDIMEMYERVNNIQEVMDNGGTQGTLPQISMKGNESVNKILDDHNVKRTIVESDDGETEPQELLDLNSLDDEIIESITKELSQGKNDENYEKL